MLGWIWLALFGYYGHEVKRAGLMGLTKQKIWSPDNVLTSRLTLLNFLDWKATPYTNEYKANPYTAQLAWEKDSFKISYNVLKEYHQNITKQKVYWAELMLELMQGGSRGNWKPSSPSGLLECFSERSRQWCILGGIYCCSSRQEHQCLMRDILPDMLFTEHWLFFLFLFGPSSHLERKRERERERERVGISPCHKVGILEVFALIQWLQFPVVSLYIFN